MFGKFHEGPYWALSRLIQESGRIDEVPRALLSEEAESVAKEFRILFKEVSAGQLTILQQVKSEELENFPGEPCEHSTDLEDLKEISAMGDEEAELLNHLRGERQVWAEELEKDMGLPQSEEIILIEAEFITKSPHRYDDSSQLGSRYSTAFSVSNISNAREFIFGNLQLKKVAQRRLKWVSYRFCDLPRDTRSLPPYRGCCDCPNQIHGGGCRGSQHRYRKLLCRS